MATDTILTPGNPSSGIPELEPIIPNKDIYLQKDNFLSEYTPDELEIVRRNLNIYSKEEVYNKVAWEKVLTQVINTILLEHLNTEDPHNIITKINKKLTNVIKNDGSVSFTSPQKGIDPIEDSHLATKKSVNTAINTHTSLSDPHKILPIVRNLLLEYIKNSEVYLKNELYTKEEIDLLQNKNIKRDGSVSFTQPQSGVDPQINSHLATKRYVDKNISNHLSSKDPHNLISFLNEKLLSYVKTTDVYTKSDSYSRDLIDSIINILVNTSVENFISRHLNGYDPHDILPKVYKEKYVKQNGSTPFTAPQLGVDAVNDLDLVTLRQVDEKITKILKPTDEKITEILQSIRELSHNVWTTSGPTLSTVGLLNVGTELLPKMTLQEIMDAIFYGKGTYLSVPEQIVIGESCPVTICTYGIKEAIDYIELYQNGELIHVLKSDQFINNCITVDSLPILTDTIFVLNIYYSNDSTYREQVKVNISMPMFVGLLPKWKFGHTITMDYLMELAKEDVQGVQNRFIFTDKNLHSVSFKYLFKDSELRHPFIVVPINYPDLEYMSTKSLSFEIDAFDVINVIPLLMPGMSQTALFKMFIYKQALSDLDLTIIFNFIPEK